MNPLDSKVAQYQRAVTPTLDPSHLQNSSASNTPTGQSSVRGKVLNYNAPNNSIRSRVTTAGVGIGSGNLGIDRSNGLTTYSLLRGNVSNTNNAGSNMSVYSTSGIANRGGAGILATNGLNASSVVEASGRVAPTILHNPMTNLTGTVGLVNNMNIPKHNVPNKVPSADMIDPFSALSILPPRYDIVPMFDEVPPDGIIITKLRNGPDNLFVIFRTSEERLRNPERLNLDRRNLQRCPILEQEQRLRLLNYQNNQIVAIENLENLPNLIFLDFYNNQLTTLNGPLNVVRGLRVLMAGKNKITQITNLLQLKKLDVLDLHSNEIKLIEGLDGLADLRVLNLAGNKISFVENLNSLQSLTELNLRRNQIKTVTGLDKLPALQRVFLSHNVISSFVDVQTIFGIKYLIELSMDGNPIADNDPIKYRQHLISRISTLKHLDLKRINDDERSQAIKSEFSNSESKMNAISNAAPVNDMPMTSPILASRKNSMGGNMNISRTSSTSEMGSLTARVAGLDLEGEYVIPPSMQVYSADSNANGMNGMVVEGISKTASIDEQKDNNANDISNIVEETPIPTVTTNLTSDVGLVQLARTGKVSKAPNMLDIEILGPDEKALIAVGETWEWPATATKRILSSVTEVIIVHMRKESIQQKFTMQQWTSMAPQLKTVRFLFNDFTSLKQVEFLTTMLKNVPQLQHLVIMENPITQSAGGILKSYFIYHFNSLRMFNEETILTEERNRARFSFGNFFSVTAKSNNLMKKRAASNNGEEGGNLTNSNSMANLNSSKGNTRASQGNLYDSLRPMISNQSETAKSMPPKLAPNSNAALELKQANKKKMLGMKDKFATEFESELKHAIQAALREINGNR